jgi:hypothetical protein
MFGMIGGMIGMIFGLRYGLSYGLIHCLAKRRAQSFLSAWKDADSPWFFRS